MATNAKPAHSIFKKSVKPPTANMLKPGTNNAKLGGYVTAKKWQDAAMYSLTLEERKTCPTTCEQWNNCYGNNMPFAHRFDHTDQRFLPLLESQIASLAKKHSNKGIVVRLHVLGDFFSPAYVEWWEYILNTYPWVRAFGYTHHRSNTTIGKMLHSLNYRMPDRWAIRFSDDPATIFSTAVIRRGIEPMVGQEVICPEQTDKSPSCSDCGLCWAQPNRKILFIEH